MSVGDLCNRTEHYCQVKSSLVVVFILGKAVKKLGGSLRVTHVRNFLISGNGDNVLEDRWDVILAHLLPIKSPVFRLVFVSIILNVLDTVSVATRITKPHIVTTTSGNESWSYVIIVHYPAVAGVKNTMLQQDCRLWGCWD